jgi:hypothetical protein
VGIVPPVLHASIEPARLSLFVALGLAACGPASGTSEASSTGAASTSSTGVVSATSTGVASATSTGASPTSTGGVEPTGGGEPTGGTTHAGATSGVLTSSTTTASSESTTAGASTGFDTSTGEMSGSTGDEVEPGCEALMQGFTDPPLQSGWQKCGDQLPHRVSARECVVPATPAKCDLQGPCTTNADCTDEPFGSCQKFTSDIEYCKCVYGCRTDADCGAGRVCRCGGDKLGPATACVPSACTVDADCGAEQCQFSELKGSGCGGVALYGGACTTDADTCASDLGCNTPPCLFEDGAWVCIGVQCGRPFIVDEQVITASALARADWTALVAAVGAPAALRDALARHWTQAACYEHASIASFARFILQLLAVGAPPALVLAAQQALADEVEHARLCFALASQHAGHDLGPGPLPLAGASGADGLAEIVAAAIREACVGETLSALELREAAARAEDPGLRRILRELAGDEQRHAELGWRFVQWALAGADAEVQARARGAFTDAIASAHADAERLSREPGASLLRGHGVLDGPLRAAVWREGLRSIVGPAAVGLAAAC